MQLYTYVKNKYTNLYVYLSDVMLYLYKSVIIKNLILFLFLFEKIKEIF